LWIYLTVNTVLSSFKNMRQECIMKLNVRSISEVDMGSYDR